MSDDLYKENEISFSEKEIKSGQLVKFLQLMLEKQLDAEPIGNNYPHYDIHIWYDGYTTVLSYVDLIDGETTVYKIDERNDY